MVSSGCGLREEGGNIVAAVVVIDYGAVGQVVVKNRRSAKNLKRQGKLTGNGYVRTIRSTRGVRFPVLPLWLPWHRGSSAGK